MTQLAQLPAIGVSEVVVRISLERSELTQLSIQQLAACRSAELVTSGYLWIYGSTSTEDIDRALNVASDAGVVLRMLWLDVEDDRETIDAAWVRALADYSLQRGQDTGIYTAAWYWRDRLGNPTHCADLPCWVAQYDDVPDLDHWDRFGGWTQIAGKQYRANETVAGIPNVDLDVFRRIIR